MNILDIILSIILVTCAAVGIGVGIVRFFFACFSLAAGIYLARLFYKPLGNELCELFDKLPPGSSLAIASFIVFFFSTIVIFQVGLFLLKLMQTLRVRWLDRLLGGLIMIVVAWGACGFLIKLLSLSGKPAMKSLLNGSFLQEYILLPLKYLGM